MWADIVHKPKSSINSDFSVKGGSVRIGHPSWTGGCGAVAQNGATVNGQPVKCWKHKGGFCLAKGGIRFVNRETEPKPMKEGDHA